MSKTKKNFTREQKIQNQLQELTKNLTKRRRESLRSALHTSGVKNIDDRVAALTPVGKKWWVKDLEMTMHGS